MDKKIFFLAQSVIVSIIIGIFTLPIFLGLALLINGGVDAVHNVSDPLVVIRDFLFMVVFVAWACTQAVLPSLTIASEWNSRKASIAVFFIWPVLLVLILLVGFYVVL